jgi:hypothetical protein
MSPNQTAEELAKEYEQLAIAATNDYCRLKRHEPVNSFPALAKQIGFCTTMHMLWGSIARQLAEGPELYETRNDDAGDYYNEYGV